MLALQLSAAYLTNKSDLVSLSLVSKDMQFYSKNNTATWRNKFISSCPLKFRNLLSKMTKVRPIKYKLLSLYTIPNLIVGNNQQKQQLTSSETQTAIACLDVMIELGIPKSLELNTLMLVIDRRHMINAILVKSLMRWLGNVKAIISENVFISVHNDSPDDTDCWEFLNILNISTLFSVSTYAWNAGFLGVFNRLRPAVLSNVSNEIVLNINDGTLDWSSFPMYTIFSMVKNVQKITLSSFTTGKLNP